MTEKKGDSKMKTIFREGYKKQVIRAVSEEKVQTEHRWNSFSCPMGGSQHMLKRNESIGTLDSSFEKRELHL